MTNFPRSGLLTPSCGVPSDVHLLRPVSDPQTAAPRSRQPGLLLRWPAQRQSRALGKPEEEEETTLFLTTIPAAWSCPDPSITVPACSPPPAPSALGLGRAVHCTNSRNLCRLSTCRARCLTPTRMTRTRPELPSGHLRHHHRPRRHIRHSVIRGKGVAVAGWEHPVPSQESGQHRTETSARTPPAVRRLCRTCCPRTSSPPGLSCAARPPEERRRRRAKSGE